MNTDVLVLGGGMAGMMAAYETASRGHTVVIIDRKSELGGQMTYQTQIIKNMPSPFTNLRGFQIITKLKSMLQLLPIQIVLQKEIIGVFADGSIGVTDGKKIERIYAKSIIIAMGAAEKAIIFPGWTLPGVMTIGAVQRFINRDRVYPGKKCVLIGSSDMTLEIAQQLQSMGVCVAGIIEASDKITATDSIIIQDFENSGINMFLNTKIIAAMGKNKVRHITMQLADGSIKTIDVDFVCIDGGREPIIEACSILNCEVTYNEYLGGQIPLYDINFQTSIEKIFVAGQTAGITLHAGIFLTGKLAGLGVNRFLDNSSKKIIFTKDPYYAVLENIEMKLLPIVADARKKHIRMCTENRKREG